MSKKQVKVFSPVLLSDGQLEKIAAVISKITGEESVVENEVDKSINAGIKVVYGTKIIDLSMDKYLEQMKEKIDE